MNNRDRYLIEQDNKNFYAKFKRNGKKRVKHNKPKKPYKNYTEYLNSERWAILRKVIIKRANYRCDICTSKEPLQVHHLNYKRIFHESYTDLIAICKKCHEKIHEVG
jgi:hypothetical protein